MLCEMTSEFASIYRLGRHHESADRDSLFSFQSIFYRPEVYIRIGRLNDNSKTGMKAWSTSTI